MSISSWRDRLLLLAPFMALGALFLASPMDDGPTFCPFALCTGTACPGCGMTRAASHLIHGDVGGAITYHPLIPLITFEIAAGWVWFALWKLGWVKPISRRALNVVLLATTATLIGVWALRLAQGSLPPV